MHNELTRVKIEHDALATDGALEVHVAEHRGFAIYEFIWILRRYEVDPDYCPDPDDGGRIPGNWVLIVNRLYRAVRIKNGAEFARGYSIDECKRQIDVNIGEKRNPIPF